jgi:hypothetical protein
MFFSAVAQPLIGFERPLRREGNKHQQRRMQKRMKQKKENTMAKRYCNTYECAQFLLSSAAL